MTWFDHALWWHVYPLGFTDAPIREGDTREGRGFAHLISWLDYVQQLGLNGLILGPIFTAKTHGYDTLNFFEIDPRLGTLQDFDAFLAACKQRGIRVLLDGVFSHVSHEYPGLAKALTAGEGSPEAVEFDIDYAAAGGPRPRVWEGHGELARFNHASPQARDTATRVMRYWLARGIDGWRLDAAYSVPTDFWQAVLADVRTDFPEAIFIGEVIHDHYATFVAESTVDSVTEYELWKAIYSSIQSKNLFELEWTLKRHNEFLDSFVPLTFVGNHDTSRIASVLGADASLTAHAILFLLGGSPAIYYGDEQGFRGVKEERIGGDDDVRQAFFRSESEFLEQGSALRDAIASLIALRRQNPWLVTARTEMLEVENERATIRLCEAKEGGRVLILSLDLSQQASATICAEDGSVLWQQQPL